MFPGVTAASQVFVDTFPTPQFAMICAMPANLISQGAQRPSKAPVVAVGVLSGIVCALFVALGVLLWKRRRQNKSSKSGWLYECIVDEPGLTGVSDVAMYGVEVKTSRSDLESGAGAESRGERDLESRRDSEDRSRATANTGRDLGTTVALGLMRRTGTDDTQSGRRTAETRPSAASQRLPLPLLPPLPPASPNLLPRPAQSPSSPPLPSLPPSSPSRQPSGLPPSPHPRRSIRPHRDFTTPPPPAFRRRQDTDGGIRLAGDPSTFRINLRRMNSAQSSGNISRRSDSTASTLPPAYDVRRYIRL
ncbi:hypothetical protein EIP86_005350 [Pleurotus ostreatoroseus]|nr:hypothetical protein EIP86_005350 [Pleurotus ostreatoroseus]